MVYAAAPAPSRQLEMWFNGPQQQRRWTVLIRLIMVIPQAIVLFILEIALLFVAIIGWFAALVIGRLPLWIHQFNSGYVRWYTRVVAYVYLMTDEYPPFEFDDLPYPARPIMAPPGTLNRLAVLFRIILVIPAYFFQTIVNYGLVLPMLFVAWIIMIFTGRMPPALYWAYSSWVRYGARVMAYVLLTTSEYPWGMLGDSSPGTPFAPPPPAPVPYATTTPAATSSPAAGITSEAEGGSAQGATGTGAQETHLAPPQREATPAAPPWPPPPPPSAGPPAWAAPTPQATLPWDPAPPPPPGAEPGRNRLALPPGARKWLIFAIVWGSILFVAEVSVQAVVAGSNLNTSVRQYNTVLNDFNDSRAAIESAIADSQSCTSVECLRGSHLAAAASLRKFDSDLKTLNLSCAAPNQTQVVESDLTQLSSAFTDLANSANAQAYRSTVQSSNLNTLLQSLPNDTNNLLDAIRSSGFGAVCSG